MGYSVLREKHLVTQNAEERHLSYRHLPNVVGNISCPNDCMSRTKPTLSDRVTELGMNGRFFPRRYAHGMICTEPLEESFL